MSKDINLPAVIPSGFGEIGGVLPEHTRTPYVSFVYAKSKNYSTTLQQIPDLKEGEPVLFLPAPAVPTVLRPFRYFLLSCSQYWGDFNKSNGCLIRSSAVKQPAPFKETVEALILVVHDGKLVPACTRFKATTCPAWAPAKRAFDASKLPSWAKLSPDHAFTAKIPHPWARFVTSANRTLKPNRETQELYPTMEAVSNPTTASELDHVVSFFQDAKGLALLAEVQKEYVKHLEESKKKEVK